MDRELQFGQPCSYTVLYSTVNTVHTVHTYSYIRVHSAGGTRTVQLDMLWLCELVSSDIRARQMVLKVNVRGKMAVASSAAVRQRQGAAGAHAARLRLPSLSLRSRRALRAGGGGGSKLSACQTYHRLSEIQLNSLLYSYSIVVVRV